MNLKEMIFLSLVIFLFLQLKIQNLQKLRFDSGLTIYTQSNGHCWGTPSPCGRAKNIR